MVVTQHATTWETNLLDDESRWRAVLNRDATANGAFVYAVQSTGVYCRPTCPSRRPRRNQVRFFVLPEAAEEAGFRPCKRCRPDQISVPDPMLDAVRLACRYIEQNLDGVKPLTLTAISKQVHTSPYHLHRSFKRIMGVTPRQYAEALRIEELKSKLKREDNVNVTAAMYDAGYGSSSRLYEKAPGQLGMTPATYRKGGPQARIGYTIVDSPLGRLLVAATDRGVCSIKFGDSDGALEAALAKEYPAAQVSRDEAGLGQWVGAILRHLQGREPHLDLPLDVKATAFQRRVWQELQAIPYGTTRSYAEVARRLGDPNATRAVARACASNPVALAIPCHRVVREDGSLGGYRWGIERKEALLAQEQKVAVEA